ncbi:GNAT family N-acetyltransferase [Clostridium senegalense]|uniref:GNAT family N-acetyltransferase n=1 Tax=Clostridium senegalense TaxID=1465809 RepID=A0A6M0H3M2_9CLOT|nr:GNAT family N-acetyltransferase [Clostridium senegalense]NEU04848.1 GNAT family N-acetyltransferase [Clostridium senegalense]
MNKMQIKKIVKENLGKYLNCEQEIFEHDGVIFHKPIRLNEFQQNPFLEITNIEKAIIVSASYEIMDNMKTLLVGKSRDEIFECPLIYGQSIYYIPDIKKLKLCDLLPKYEYFYLEGNEINKLREIKGFTNSLEFDEDGSTSTAIVFFAMKDGEIIGLAGASNEYSNMWEMGIDVKSNYRTDGLATVLVNHLMHKILSKNVLPIYCASSSNIASQAVAHRAGLIPYWISTYKNILDGSSSYNELVKPLYE